ncbi:MAG TPA: hypothetical protein VJ914_27795 [Pseudonocardiaceae bacterium]|nr:hypothetical protein [Pseudonocardiaceae bacterium]
MARDNEVAGQPSRKPLWLLAIENCVQVSERDRRYYLCVAIVEPVQLKPLRRKLSCLLMPGQRELHFKQEKPPRRRAMADKIALMPVTVRIYQTAYTPKTEESARQACLDLAMTDLLKAGAHRLVIDTRAERDRFDANTIRNQLHDMNRTGQWSQIGPWKARNP